MRVRTTFLLLLLLLPALASSFARAEDATDAALGRLHAALIRADTRVAYETIGGLFEAGGLEMPGLLAFREQPALELLSRYSPTEKSLTQSRLLRTGEGYAYWDRWSEHLTAGAWDPRRAFASEEEARLVGNFALLGILAHEIGHALCDAHDLNLHDVPYRELLADEYAVRMMNLWARHPELARLRGAYRDHVVGGLRRAVPDGVRIDLPRPDGAPLDVDGLRAFCASYRLPRDLTTAGYVSFQLARQELLLDDPRLDTLPAFLAAERARKAPRRWVSDRIELRTVPGEEVPAWMLVRGSPRELWSVEASDLDTAIARALGRELPTGDTKTLWALGGPQRAFVAVERKDLWPEAPIRVVRLERREDGTIEGTPLGAGKADLGFLHALRPHGETAALWTVELGPGGLVHRWRVADPTSGRLVPGALDGLSFRGEGRDGDLDGWTRRLGSAWPLDADRLLVATEARLRVLRGRRLHTLAGDVRGYRDGTDPRAVRLAETRVLGAEDGVVYLRTAGPDGPTFRTIRW
jgi:hypothetical protein